MSPAALIGFGGAPRIWEGIAVLALDVHVDVAGQGIAREILRPCLAASLPAAEVGGNQRWLDEGRQGRLESRSVGICQGRFRECFRAFAARKVAASSEKTKLLDTAPEGRR